jgi:hypothetical protein
VRQVLFPHPEHGYVALAPLGSSAFAGHLADVWWSRQEQTKERGGRWLKQAFMGFGGSNPQNAGRLMRRMQRPFVFFAPRENREIRRAIAIHYKGSEIVLPRALMEDYRAWREQALTSNALRSDIRSRREEHRYIQALVRAALRRAREDEALLARYADALPGGEASGLVSPDAPLVAAGLADHSRRARGWVRAFAEAMASRIASYRYRDEKRLGLSDPAIASIAAAIEKEARSYV